MLQRNVKKMSTVSNLTAIKYYWSILPLLFTDLSAVVSGYFLRFAKANKCEAPKLGHMVKN